MLNRLRCAWYISLAALLVYAIGLASIGFDWRWPELGAALLVVFGCFVSYELVLYVSVKLICAEADEFVGEQRTDFEGDKVTYSLMYAPTSLWSLDFYLARYAAAKLHVTSVLFPIIVIVGFIAFVAWAIR